MRKIVVIFALVFLFVPSLSFAQPLTPDAEAAITESRWPQCTRHNFNYIESGSGRCDGESPVLALAQSSEYGPFLCGVCKSCMDRGECTLTDTMIVVGNAGNFMLGIVGSLSLLLFVIGGMMILVSQGEEKLKTGRQFIFASAVGVAITFGAILILRTLINTVTTGSPGSGSSSGVVCDGSNDGVSCGEASQCYKGTCKGLCEITQIEESVSNSSVSYACVDPTPLGPYITCVTNRCPGGADNVCCTP